MKADVENQLIDDIAGFTHNPLGFVQYAYEWGKGELANSEGPRKWQSEVLSAIGKHLRNPETRFQPLMISVASGHGIGKAQPKSLMIHTPDGLVRWGDLKVGDHVFGKGGRPTRITAIHDRGLLPVYRVVFDDRSETVCCADHLWTVKGRQERRKCNGWITLSTDQLIERGLKRSNGIAEARQFEIPRHAAVEFPAHDLPVHPYTLGVWLGDGGRNSSRITSADDDVIDRLVEFGEVVSKHVGYAWGIRDLHKKLRQLGIADRYSYQKSVPVQYMESPSSVRADVLRGLLDTDGECTKAGSIVFSSASEALARDVIWLVRSLGGKATMQPTTKSPSYKNGAGELVAGLPCHRVTLCLPPEINPFNIGRKQSRVATVQERYLKRWINSIEPAGEDDCMCITVEAEDSLYLTNDFIVTHNSANISQVINWGMSTCEDCKVVITANTENQLRTKTWPEVGKWLRLAINSHWFKHTATAMFSTDPKHEKTWRADAVPWSENNTEAFAGLHNEGKRIIVIFDEGSAIADKVWEVAEGALTDENTEIIWLVYGNPTRATGRFRECFRRWKHRWKTWQIDSRTVEGTNKKQISKWVEDYGEDSDFVKIRVRGIFPSMSAKQFISEADVDLAFGRHLRKEQFEFAPVILGVDPAWSGDDELVIVKRQGLYSEVLVTMPKNDNDVHVANIICRLQDEHKAAAVFVDGGYGTGIVSAGKTMGRSWQIVWFGGGAIDKGCKNKRAEMWRDMRDWIKAGGAIPPDNVLRDDLTGIETIPNLQGLIQLEPKEALKERGLPSPNRADALALTFAFPVMQRSPNAGPQMAARDKAYDPYAV